jgi:hypothetical protein
LGLSDCGVQLMNKELRLRLDPSIFEPRGSTANSFMFGPRELWECVEKVIQTHLFIARTALRRCFLEYRKCTLNEYK